MRFRLSEPGNTSELDAYYEFRWQRLRAPWDMPRGSEKDALEADAKHVMASNEAGEIIGVGRIHLNDDGSARIRYMATHEDWRGQGIGTAIVRHLERLAFAMGARRIIINARENAFEFYEKLGYEIFADSSTMIGTIRHKLMRRDL